MEPLIKSDSICCLLLNHETISFKVSTPPMEPPAKKWQYLLFAAEPYVWSALSWTDSFACTGCIGQCISLREQRACNTVRLNKGILEIIKFLYISNCLACLASAYWANPLCLKMTTWIKWRQIGRSFLVNSSNDNSKVFITSGELYWSGKDGNAIDFNSSLSATWSAVARVSQNPLGGAECA